jgi:hypothetical protein
MATVDILSAGRLFSSIEGEQKNAGGRHPSSRLKTARVHPKEFAPHSGSAFVSERPSARLVCTISFVFDGPAPLTRALRGRRAVQINSVVGSGVNPPGSGSCEQFAVWAKKETFPGYHPKHGAILHSRFCLKWEMYYNRHGTTNAEILSAYSPTCSAASRFFNKEDSTRKGGLCK